MNYYELLDVSEDASPDEIKRAYRRKASKLHPDRNPDRDGSEFIQIKQAYECLSDPERRVVYDETGRDGAGEEVDPVERIFIHILNESLIYLSSAWEVLEKVNSVVSDLEGEAGQRLSELEVIEKNLNEIIQSTKFEGEGINLIATIAQSKIEDCQAQMDDLKNTLKHCASLRVRLKDYSSKTKPPRGNAIYSPDSNERAQREIESRLRKIFGTI